MTQIKRAYVYISLSIFALLSGQIAYAAGKDDFLKELVISADIQNIDGEAEKVFYKGDVKVTQGSLSINANEVEVSRGENEDEEVFIARGNPATYSQLDDEGRMVTAQAQEIRYEQQTGTVELTGAAKITLDGQSTESELITYNIEAGTLDAGVEGSNERVVTIYQPKPKTDEKEDKQP